MQCPAHPLNVYYDTGNGQLLTTVHANLEAVVSRAGRGTHQSALRSSSKQEAGRKGGRLNNCGMDGTRCARGRVGDANVFVGCTTGRGQRAESRRGHWVGICWRGGGRGLSSSLGELTMWRMAYVWMPLSGSSSRRGEGDRPRASCELGAAGPRRYFKRTVDSTGTSSLRRPLLLGALSALTPQAFVNWRDERRKIWLCSLYFLSRVLSVGVASLACRQAWTGDKAGMQRFEGREPRRLGDQQDTMCRWQRVRRLSSRCMGTGDFLIMFSADAFHKCHAAVPGHFS